MMTSRREEVLCDALAHTRAAIDALRGQVAVERDWGALLLLLRGLRELSGARVDLALARLDCARQEIAA